MRNEQRSGVTGRGCVGVWAYGRRRWRGLKGHTRQRSAALSLASLPVVMLLAGACVFTSVNAWGQSNDFDGLMREGRDDISKGRYDAAIDVLRRAATMNPKSSYAYHLLGLAYRGAKNDTESTRYVCEALQLDPGNDDIRKSVAESLQSGLPRRAREATLRTLQEVYYEDSWNREEFTFDVTAMATPPAAKSYRAFSTSGTLFPPEVPQRDPLHAKMSVSDLPEAWKFNRVAYGYMKESSAADWTLRIRLFYVSPFLAGGGRDYGPLSRMLCRMALQIFTVVQDNLGAPPIGTDPVIDIWLCEPGEAGAQQPIQAPGNIYFYDINRQRPWSEWVREMTHEYGHIVIAPLGGYTNAREPFANGEIGERLFMPWLRDSLGLRPDALRPEDGKQLDEYAATKSDAALKLFLQEGPESPLFYDRGDWGIQDLAGFCLWIARTHTPAFLQACMDSAVKKVGPQELRSVDLRDAYQRLFAENVEKGLAYRAGLPIPKFTQLADQVGRDGVVPLKQNDAVAYWLYLPEGTWEVRPRIESSGTGVLAFAWTGAGHEEHGLIINPAKESGVILEKAPAGWHILRIQGKNLPSPVHLTALVFRKAQP